MRRDSPHRPAKLSVCRFRGEGLPMSQHVKPAWTEVEHTTLIVVRGSNSIVACPLGGDLESNASDFYSQPPRIRCRLDNGVPRNSLRWCAERAQPKSG